MADVSFNDWKISRKLAVGFALMVLVIMATGAITFYNMGQLTKARTAYSGAQDALTSVSQANFLLARQENSLRGYLITLDPYYLERAAAHRDNFGKALEGLRGQLANDPAMVEHIDAAKAAADDWYVQVVDGAAGLAANPLTYQDATDMIGSSGIADGLMGKVEEPLEAISTYETEQAVVLQKRLATINQQTTLLISGALLLATLAAIAIGWLLARMIGAPIVAMTSAMRRLAEGDASVEVPARGRKDEVGEMAEAVQVFKEFAHAGGGAGGLVCGAHGISPLGWLRGKG